MKIEHIKKWLQEHTPILVTNKFGRIQTPFRSDSARHQTLDILAVSISNLEESLSEIIKIQSNQIEQLKQKAIEGYSVGYNAAMTKYKICENDREMRSQKDWEEEIGKNL